MTPRGGLALVLHTHMPYVEGFGTWPFGEEWLFEAMATCYLPLVEVLERGAPLTLSVTPVLCDQLSAPGIGDRFRAFLRDVRRETHRRDIEGRRASGEEALAAELERSAQDYERALSQFDELDGDLVGALAPHAAWTSAATHAVLPLVATDAGARLQLTTGIESHRERVSRPWRGGFWLPECAEAEWLDPLLEEAGVRAVCVDLTDVLGRGAPEHLRPVATEAGPLLVPIDRSIIDLVWHERGYPSNGAYRDSHRLTIHDHKPWAIDGSVYEAERAADQVRRDAADFVARASERVADGGLAVCALDTELLGHWWYEGIRWLSAVISEAADQGLPIVHVDDAIAEAEPAPPLPSHLRGTSWGDPRDLSTWCGPQVADLAWRAREAELRVVAAGPEVPERAVRELLALQSSDWAFLESGGQAGPYARERAAGHLRDLDAALGAGKAADPALRNLAPGATAAPLLVP